MKIININTYDQHRLESTDGLCFELNNISESCLKLIEMAKDSNEPIAIIDHQNIIEKVHPCFDEIVAEIYQDSSAFEVSLQSMPAIYKISKEDIELIDIFNNAYSNKLPIWVAFSSDGEIISASLKEVA